MSAADKLAQVLAEHTTCWDGAFGQWGCTCGDAAYESHEYCYAEDEHAAHQAAVVLAHLTAEGWAQGREEWGLDWGDGECYPEPDKASALEWLAGENASEKLIRRRVTDWEPVEGDQS